MSVYDKNSSRLEILKDKTEETNKSLHDLKKFDMVIECTGAKEVLETVIKESRLDSTILLLGFPYGEVHYNFEDVVGNEKVIMGSVGAEREDFVKALEILPTLDTVHFTENVLPLKDFKKAWDLHSSRKYIKLLLKP